MIGFSKVNKNHKKLREEINSTKINKQKSGHKYIHTTTN